MPCHEPLIVNPVLKSGYPHSNGTITVDKDKVSNPSPPNRPNRQVKKSYTTGSMMSATPNYNQSSTKMKTQNDDRLKPNLMSPPPRSIQSPIDSIPESDEITINNNNNNNGDDDDASSISSSTTITNEPSISSSIKPTQSSSIVNQLRYPLSPTIDPRSPSRNVNQSNNNNTSSSSKNSRSSIFSWTRKRAMRFMSTVGQSLDQSIQSVQSFLSPPPDSIRTGVASSSGNAHNYHQHRSAQIRPKTYGIVDGYSHSHHHHHQYHNPQQQQHCGYQNPYTAINHNGNYIPKGDPFWFHKAYYESKTKQHHQPQSTSNNIVNNNDRFYYVYENGYIKKKWVCYDVLVHCFLLCLLTFLPHCYNLNKCVCLCVTNKRESFYPSISSLIRKNKCDQFVIVIFIAIFALLKFAVVFVYV